MPYNTQPILRDQQNSPISQYFNPVTDVYEALYGRNGANRVELYGPDGNPISTTTGKLDVRASELETILNTLATQTTLASLLGQADITMSALRDALRGLDSKTLSDLATLLTAIKDTTGIKKITDPLPAGANNIGDVDIASAIPVGDNVIGRAKITDGTTVAVVDATTQRLKTDAMLTGSSIAGGDGAFWAREFGSVAANTIVNVYTAVAGKSIEIMALEFSCNNDANPVLWLTPLDDDGSEQRAHILLSDGSNFTDVVSIANIRAHGHPWLEIVKDAAGTYKAILRPGIRILMPNGGNVKIKNNSGTTAYNIACSVLIRKVVA